MNTSSRAFDHTAPAPITATANDVQTKKTKLTTKPVWLCIRKDNRYIPIMRVPTTTYTSIRLNRAQWLNWLHLSQHDDNPPSILIPDRFGDWRYVMGTPKRLKQTRNDEPCMVLI